MKKKLICVGLSLLTVFSCVACRSTSEQIDETRSQLYVFNYDAGFGSDWLKTAIERFEAKYADTSFEAGKQGVQVWVDNQISIPDNNTVKGQNNAIYFLEEKDYYEGISQGVYKDITSWMKEPLTEYGETESIEDKMYAYGTTFPDFYKTSEGKYYAIPFHEGFWGINYDVDLFGEKELFMTTAFEEKSEGASHAESIPAYWSNGKEKSNLSKGPDGAAGTIDDGLPATYDDFYVLLDRMLVRGVTPFHWSGKSIRYTTNMMYNLWVDYEGEEQMMLNYRMNGNATDLSTIDGGALVTDETPLAITQANGYELQRQAGKYYALSFAQKIVTDKRYYNDLAYSPSETHKTAQATYLYSGLNGSPVAFLIDGSYWQREANAIFTEMGAVDESYSRASRKFGMLPFPKATAKKVGEKQTIAGGAGSYMVVNGSSSAGVTKQMEMAKLFIQYIHTDEILKVFTENTGSTRPLDYDFTEAEMAAQPYYTQTIWNLHKNNKIICPWANTSLIISNHDEFNDQNNGFKYSSVQTTPFEYLKEISAEEAFGKLYDYKKNKWPQLG